MTYITNKTSRDYRHFEREYSNGVPVYFGRNMNVGALSTDETWEITKFLFDIDGNFEIDIKTGVAWADRATLDWAI